MDIYWFCSSHLTGMIAGYVLFKYKEPPKVSQTFNLCMWILSVCCMLGAVFCVINGTLTVIQTAFYVSFSHTGKPSSMTFL